MWRAGSPGSCGRVVHSRPLNDTTLYMRPIVPSIVMTASEAFYLPLGDGRFEPTRATESPWDQTAQHGGPPAALLAHLIDATVDGELRLARLSIDFFGAIPRKPVTSRSNRSSPDAGSGCRRRR